MHKLTVLICCHNHASYIDRCLKSLSEQTLDFKNWSILFLLDGCTDNSEEELERVRNKYKLPELRVIKREKKTRLAQAKNFGLRHVDTPWVCFTDCDDENLPERLETQFKIINNETIVFNSNGIPYYPDIISTLSWTRLKNGRLVKSCFDINQYDTHDKIIARLNSENILNHGSVACSMNALMLVEFYDEDEKYKGCEDWRLWIKLMQSGFKFYNCNERLYIWSAETSTLR